MTDFFFTMVANVTNKHWPALHCYFFPNNTKYSFHVTNFLTKRLAGLGLFDVCAQHEHEHTLVVSS